MPLGDRKLAVPWSRATLLALAVGLGSLALRLALIWVNRDANDPHINVIELILESGALPDQPMCGQCYQPKLFHATIALLLWIGGISADLWRIFAAQAVNALAGAATLGVAWRFLSRYARGSEGLKLLAFTLLALNPKLIGINSQATNDSFVILFSSLALYGTWELFRRESPLRFVLVVLAGALAIASKTNAWVIVLAIFLALLARVVLERERRGRFAAYALGWLVLVPALGLLNPLTQYRHHWRKFGTPVTLNHVLPPQARFFEHSVANRPGVVSIQDALFTFKLVSLLRHPRIDTLPPSYPGHRTSIWSQLYGRAHSVSFDNHPDSWEAKGTGLFPMLRATFVLALLPTALLLLGGLRQGGSFLVSLWRRSAAQARALDWGLVPLALWGALTFVALFALRYRDFAYMKAIYLFPALLAFPAAFLAGAERLSPRARTGVIVAGIALVVLYISDVAALISRLMT